MLARLVNVIGWTANVVAVLVLVAGVSFCVIVGEGRLDLGLWAAIMAVAGVVAVLVFLIGRAVRYVLIGSK
jgi:hypothetical protein